MSIGYGIVEHYLSLSDEEFELMTEQLQTEKDEAVEKKEIKPVDKTGYRIREQVKSGKLDPKEVLVWYKEQPEQFSKALVTWLRNRIVAGKKKEEKVEEVEVKNEDKKKKKFKGKKGKSKKSKKEVK